MSDLLKGKIIPAILCNAIVRTILFVFVVLAVKSSYAQLIVKGDDNGIVYLSYNNTELINRWKNTGWGSSAEAFTVIRKRGEVEHVWSHQASVRRTNSSINEWLYKYNFGELLYSCRQEKDVLFLTLTIKNMLPGDTLCGVNLIPLQMVFPQRPVGFQPLYPYYHYNLDAPSIVTVDFRSGKFSLSNEEMAKNFFTGLIDVTTYDGSVLYKVWASNIPFNGMNTAGVPSLNLKLAPGKSYTYKLALRFYPPGTSVQQMASPVMAAYKNASGIKFSWSDRRMIGALVISSVSKQDGKSNPRGWLPTEKINTLTVAGRADLKAKILAYARQSVTILKDMDAQGMITWDIEGQQFPHAISYVGSPDKIKSVAPEMDAIADEYFNLFRKAGLRTGVCVRPQEFTLNKDGSWAVQKDVRDPASVLIRKIKYAYKRWGCTLFYIDSNVDSTTALMSASIFKKVQEAVPYALLIPEHQNTRYYEYTAPYEDMRFGMTHMDEMTRAAYPSGFLVINTAEGMHDAQGNRRVTDEMLKASIQEGNILMFRAWYYDPGNAILKKVYQEVKGSK